MFGVGTFTDGTPTMTMTTSNRDTQMTALPVVCTRQLEFHLPKQC